jgi:L-ascorbate metabolism protein UlaG (beta-lactamase superfamily)
MQLPEFGKAPYGASLEKVLKSPHYINGAFQNSVVSPVMTNDGNVFSIFKKFISNDNTPKSSIPSIKTNLLNLDPKENILVWFGHSSYFMQIDGKKFLVDPVLSGSASPFSFIIKAFKGSDIYKPEDIPDIDYLIITHDHWDHLDYKTIVKLKPKIKNIITPLGVGSDFIYWGFDKNIVTETDWGDTTKLTDGFTINTTESHHFGGRTFKRNNTLWASYVLQTPSLKIFLGGDSGYGPHFKEIGEKFGPFDLAILEDGQYNKSWKYIHMVPNETLQAGKDLEAKRILPVHNSKFKLSVHPWKEPLEMITELDKSVGIPLVTPMIGEKVNLKDNTQKFTEWWKGLR